VSQVDSRRNTQTTRPQGVSRDKKARVMGTKQAGKGRPRRKALWLQAAGLAVMALGLALLPALSAGSLMTPAPTTGSERGVTTRPNPSSRSLSTRNTVMVRYTLISPPWSARV